MIIYQSRIYRADLRANPDVYYIFGDNVERIGLGGQAKEMRGEPNAVGVATKWAPRMNDSDFFSDDQYDEITQILLNDLRPIMVPILYQSSKCVIVPMDGIGTGLSELPTRAPKIYQFLCGLGLGGKNDH